MTSPQIRVDRNRRRLSWVEASGTTSVSIPVPNSVGWAVAWIVPDDVSTPWDALYSIEFPGGVEISIPMSSNVTGPGLVSNEIIASPDFPTIVPPVATGTFVVEQTGGTGTIRVYLALVDADY